MTTIWYKLTKLRCRFTGVSTQYALKIFLTTSLLFSRTLNYFLWRILPNTCSLNKHILYKHQYYVTNDYWVPLHHKGSMLLWFSFHIHMPFTLIDSNWDTTYIRIVRNSRFLQITLFILQLMSVIKWQIRDNLEAIKHFYPFDCCNTYLAYDDYFKISSTFSANDYDRARATIIKDMSKM